MKENGEIELTSTSKGEKMHSIILYGEEEIARMENTINKLQIPESDLRWNMIYASLEDMLRYLKFVNSTFYDSAGENAVYNPLFRLSSLPAQSSNYGENVFMWESFRAKFPGKLIIGEEGAICFDTIRIVYFDGEKIICKNLNEETHGEIIGHFVSENYA